MSNSKKAPRALIFVDYVPAELRENKRWEIIYRVFDPFQNKLVRKAVRVRPLKSINERRKLARRMVKNINKQLERGWNPLKTEETASAFKSFVSELDIFLKRKERESQKNDLRKDSIRTYKSFARVIKKYLIDNRQESITIFDFNTYFISEFLDYVYFDRENSATTRNNYLVFLVMLCNHFKSKKFIGSNPAEAIKRIRTKDKVKVIIPDKYRKALFNYLSENNNQYLTLCLASYFCFLRRTELALLRVRDIQIKKSVIVVRSEVSKNKKTQIVTIPEQLINRLATHIARARKDDYVFSENNYLPGPHKLKPKKISDEWTKLRPKIGLPRNFVWYNLKDTGITNLLATGIPAIKVRDQARHYSIQQTEQYTPKFLLRADKDILTNEVIF